MGKQSRELLFFAANTMFTFLPARRAHINDAPRKRARERGSHIRVYNQV